MSFAILIYIFLMLYICLKKYSSIFSVVFVIVLVFGATTAFLLYGIKMLGIKNVFMVINTEINAAAFYSFCAVWYIADMFCTYRAIRTYMQYISINGTDSI